jgi:DNA-binding CsgD family transcriptional regulator
MSSRLLLDNTLKSVPYMPGLVAAKDNDSIYYSASTLVAEYLGLKSAEEIVGCSDLVLPSKLVKFADTFVKYDQLVTSGKIACLTSVEVLQYVCGVRILFSKRLPLVNHTNEIVGLLTQSMDVTEVGLFQAFLVVEQLKNQSLGQANFGSYIISDTQELCGLTPRQQDCLFFLLRGLSSKQIAAALKLSVRTIENYLEQLKAKFHCRSKADLYEAALAQGLYYYVPQRLLDSSLLKF